MFGGLCLNHSVLQVFLKARLQPERNSVGDLKRPACVNITDIYIEPCGLASYTCGGFCSLANQSLTEVDRCTRRLLASRCVVPILRCFRRQLRARTDTDLKCPVIIANSEEMLNISF